MVGVAVVGWRKRKKATGGWKRTAKMMLLQVGSKRKKEEGVLAAGRR